MGKWLGAAPEHMTFEVRDRIAHITFNHPEKRNALNLEALGEFHLAVREADDLKEVRVVVIGGNGKDFCAGADISGAPRPDRQGYDPKDYRAAGDSFDDDAWGVERRSEIRLALHQAHKPIIAKVQGNCLAVGTDIALLCDFIIVAHDARIGFPATRALGSPGNHMWLYHVGPQWAKRFLMTGDVIRGKDAARIGLALKAVPAEKLDQTVEKLARRLAILEPDLMAAQKRIVNLGLELMGFGTLQRLAAENDARAHLSGAFKNYVATSRSAGHKEALRLRDEPYGSDEISLDGEDA
jgi:enoyl-CoA hydratase